MIFLNKKFLIISVSSAILTAVLVYFGAYSLYKAIENNAKELALLERDAGLIGNELNKEKKIKDASAILSERTTKINSVFVNSEIPIEFIQFLENTANDNNILIDISPVAFKKEEGAIWVPIGFQVNLAGSFSKCRTFLEKVEFGPYLLAIENLNTQKVAKREAFIERDPNFPANGVSMNITIKAFAK